jgi:hypothetical protein
LRLRDPPNPKESEPCRPTSGTTVGVLIAAALVYVGHGLHQGADPSPAFVSVVHAQEVDQRPKLSWEYIEVTTGGAVARTKIPGGWLVRSSLSTRGSSGGMGIGLAFVPDPEHKWDGKSLP